MPVVFLVRDHGWQLVASLHERGKGILLAYRLAVILVDPFRRSVGGNDDQRHTLIVSLCHGGCVIQEGCARRADESHGSPLC